MYLNDKEVGTSQSSSTSFLYIYQWSFNVESLASSIVDAKIHIGKTLSDKLSLSGPTVKARLNGHRRDPLLLVRRGAVTVRGAFLYSKAGQWAYSFTLLPVLRVETSTFLSRFQHMDRWPVRRHGATME